MSDTTTAPNDPTDQTTAGTDTNAGATDPGSARLLPDQPVPSLEAYVAAGGGRGLRWALDHDPDEVVAAVEASGLRGRGGAGFPTGGKWRAIVESARDQDLAVSLVVNGAEGEPGTYKDRALLLLNPYQVVEGLLIACHAVGAQQAYVGVKASFTEPRERLQRALAEAVAAGWPCADRVAIVAGPDEYLFGEEKALLEVIEGKLPMPRHLAPYVNGLFTDTSNPSVALVNNVETLANVPLIAAHGADWYRRVGTERAPGTMVFTVTGDVATAGVFELPLGTPLRVLLEDIAGAEDIQAVFSGTSNAVITPAMLDTPLEWEALRDAGSGLGSGGFIVYDASHCIVRVAATLTRFLAVESCGQCNACKLGTGVLADILARVDAGSGTGLDLERLASWAGKVTDLARCGLPTGAQLMVASLLEEFEDDLIAHLGRPCWSQRHEVVPKIDHLDLDTGEVTFDPTYHRKRPDWTYAEEPAEEPVA